MKSILFSAVLLNLLLLSSCVKTDTDPDPVLGCTDSKAINYNPSATKDNGTCRYSTVTFYGSYTYYSGIPIIGVTVSVNGNNLGNLTAVYPSGPGNCSATGTIAYPFSDGRTIDWNATMQLANGALVYSSGSVTPGIFECIKVNVTR